MPQAIDQVQTFIDRLVTDRKKAADEMEQMLAVLNTENRDFSAEEKEKWERIDADIKTKGDQIRDFADRQRTEKEHDQLREEWAHIVRPETSDRQDADQRSEFEIWVRGQGPGNADGGRQFQFDLGPIAQERMLIRRGATGEEFRTNLNVGTAGQGKNLVPTDFLRRLYDYMEAASGIRRTNATILSTAGGEPIQIPTVTAHGTAAIVGEGTALAAADPAFGQVTLGSYKYGQLTQITHELLQDSGVDVLGFLARDFGRGLGRVTGTAYVRGSGTNAPHGVGVRAGTATTTQTVATGVPSYGDLVTTVYSIIEEYRSNGAVWVMADAYEGTIRRITDTTGRPLWQPSLVGGEPDLLLGYPVIDDRNMDAAGTAAGTPMFFGDFEPYYIRDAGLMRIERSDDFAFSSDIVTYRAIMRTDADLIDLQGAVKKVLAPTT